MQCNSMQSLCAHLTGGSISLLLYIYIYIYMKCNGMQSLCAKLTGGLDLAVGVAVFKASMIN